MKRTPRTRLLAAAALLATVVAACAPQTSVISNVVPTLFSITTPQDGGSTVHLQGRYFGGGTDDDSYVIIGAASDCTGGVEVQADSWSTNRIAFTDPGGVGAGFVCVVASGTLSNGLPADLN